MTSTTGRGTGVSRVDPRVIRAVLDAGGSESAAARRTGVHPTTVRRWRARRAEDPAWPTDADVTAWDNAQADPDGSRAHAARISRAYRRRRYLERGLMKVDPTGTTRRMQALYAIGYTSGDLAPRLGCSTARVGHLVAGLWQQVHRDTAAAVADLYDELSMTVPEDEPTTIRGRIRVHDRQRRQSAAKGFAPPLAWDDDTIDDPAAVPDGIRPATCDVERVPRTGGHLFGRPLDPDTVEDILAGDWTRPCSRDDKVAVVAAWISESRGSLRMLEQLTGWNNTRYADAARAQLAEADAA